MKVFHEAKKLTDFIGQCKEKGQSVGFVPTMGALHLGHLSLIQTALSENDLAVVSIFVNPTQFDNQSDLTKYPRNLKKDLQTLSVLSENRIVVYAPEVADIYPRDVNSETYTFGGLEFEMEGRYRKGHFNGVATVVRRLFNIVRPHKAYFGEKDFQQLQIIRELVRQLKLGLDIVGVSIFREADGLAMSSRNERLSDTHRKAAPFIYAMLKAAKTKFGTKSAKKITEWVSQQFEGQEHLDLEYFTIAEEETLKPIKRKSKNKRYRAFIAVHAGDVRLIDNIALN